MERIESSGLDIRVNAINKTMRSLRDFSLNTLRGSLAMVALPYMLPTMIGEIVRSKDLRGDFFQGSHVQQLSDITGCIMGTGLTVAEILGYKGLAEHVSSAIYAVPIITNAISAIGEFGRYCDAQPRVHIRGP